MFFLRRISSASATVECASCHIFQRRRQGPWRASWIAFVPSRRSLTESAREHRQEVKTHNVRVVLLRLLLRISRSDSSSPLSSPWSPKRTHKGGCARTQASNPDDGARLFTHRANTNGPPVTPHVVPSESMQTYLPQLPKKVRTRCFISFKP